MLLLSITAASLLGGLEDIPVPVNIRELKLYQELPSPQGGDGGHGCGHQG